VVSVRHIEIPKGFLLGVATSAYQIEGAWNEGGRGRSIWDTFTQTAGKAVGDVPGDRGVEHYRRWREDVAMMKEMGIDSYRFSLSWPRLLPAGTGRVNAEGVDFYDRLIDALLEADIIPNATIYHWDLPQALQDRGGWPNRDVVDWFAEYASLVFSEFGDRVPMWATLNEPIANWVGYATDFFAPGTADPRAGRQAMHNAMLAHGQAVREFRRSGRSGKIGIVVDVWKRHPLTDSEGDRALALRDEDDSFRFFFSELFGGGLNQRTVERLTADGTLPDIRPGDAELAAEPIDFLGINVYQRVIVDSTNYTPNWWEATDRRPGGNYLSNGVELWPQALGDAVRVARDEYGVTVPIYITESGVALEDVVAEDGVVHDSERQTFVAEYLAEAVKARADGLDVQGFYVWTLTDNYEWAAAYSARFGLARVDPVTFDRTLKESGRWFGNVARSRGYELPDQAADR
jgi:beta-glucosidase